MTLENNAVLELIRARFGSGFMSADEFRGDLALTIRPEMLVELATFLRSSPDLQYIHLASVSGVDYLHSEPRFEVVYHFASFVHGHRVALKVGAPADDPRVPSLAREFPTATYQEREVYDMFGIGFDGHPDLQRILMPEDWDGYPQRKTEPLVYEEVAFTFNHDEIDAQKPYARE